MMRDFKKVIVPVFLIALALLMPACRGSGIKLTAIGLPVACKQEHNADAARRFQSSGPTRTTVVESALQLSEKYAKLSEQTAALKEENHQLRAENEQFNNQVAALESTLQQTREQLEQVNGLLVDMRIELNNWKTDILGFRGEIRDAEKAQLEALLKILKVLGGEIKDSAKKTDVDSTAASAKKPAAPAKS